jgi:hypothetical protein
MRSLYLFLGEILSTERRGDPERAWSGVANQELRPISPGSFARWMRARDQADAVPRAGSATRAPSRASG